MTATTYLAIGGPLAGHRVTEQYAGDDYHRFNSAEKVRKGKPKCTGCRKNYLREWREPKPGRFGMWVHRTGVDKPSELQSTFACGNQDPDKPSGVLVHKSVWEQ